MPQSSTPETQAVIERLLRQREAARSALRDVTFTGEVLPALRNAAPNRLVHVGGVQAVAAGAVSPGYRVDWPVTGLVLAFSGSVDSGDPADLSVMDLQVSRDGNRDLISDGLNADFCPFADLFPFSAPRFPLFVGVKQGNVWFVTFQNRSGQDALLPSVTFFVLSDQDK